MPLDRRDALAVLRLPPSADHHEIKRAYRRLARSAHPDLGGDPALFHELQAAFEALEGTAPGAPPATVTPGRPSRTREAWDAERDDRRRDVDVDAIDWTHAVPREQVALARDLLAVVLAEPSPDPVRAVVATSRAPGSRLNRAAASLSPDLTSALRVGPGRDDRGRTVVAATVTSGNRKARRVLDRGGVGDGWMRTRGSSATTLRWVASPDDDRRRTAVRAVDAIEVVLDRLDWPLQAWILTRD